MPPEPSLFQNRFLHFIHLQLHKQFVQELHPFRQKHTWYLAPLPPTHGTAMPVPAIREVHWSQRTLLLPPATVMHPPQQPITMWWSLMRWVVQGKVIYPDWLPRFRLQRSAVSLLPLHNPFASTDLPRHYRLLLLPEQVISGLISGTATPATAIQVAPW